MPGLHDAVQTGIDHAFISTFFNLTENDVVELATTPTTNSIIVFLQLVTEKAKEFEQLRASKLQLDVELETATRTADTKLKAQKATAHRQAKEIEELRNKLNESQSTQEQLSARLSNLQHDASDSTAETQALRRQIETLESSKRATLVTLERQTTEKDNLHKQIQESHKEVITLKADVRRLEQQNSNLENQAAGQKHKEQILRQELELLKRNNEWHAQELAHKTTEYSQFRKERNASLNAVQRELEDATATVETLRQTEASLRSRFDELQSRTEQAFTRNAELQEAAARAEQNFKAELDNTRRLAKLHEKNAATHKARLDEVQAQVDQIRDDAAVEIGRLQTEIETERSDRRQAEETIADLELRLEHQERQTSSSVAGSPNGHSSALITTGSAQKMVRNLTNTQMYSQFVEARQDLENGERRSAKLQAALDELIQEMESRAPELLELRQEQDRLEAEVLEFSRMLDEANETRDAAVKEAQRWQTENAALTREGDILRQQLRDLSAQVKILLVEMQSRERGLEDMSVQERLELERAARGEADYTNNTSRLISERLVLFRNVFDLQERNQQLLRLTRELGDKMEGEEAMEKQRQSAAEATENTQLRAQLERYQDEMQATTAQIDSYMKERDMFRRMLQHRGTLPADADAHAMFGSSIVPATPQRNGIEPASPRPRDVEDLTKLLKEQQKSFDEYRTESSADRRILKDQVDALAHEKTALQMEVARAQASLQLSRDRFELLQGNLKSLTSENSQLRERNQQLSETAAKQDLRTLQAAEDSIEASSAIASLRAENANIKAEKDLWKRSEARLLEDNKNLMDERTRISKLNSDLSSLANERERADNEARRRLQARVDTLESQLAEAGSKLDAEIESSRKAMQRREFEEEQNRARVDDLTKVLGNLREELTATKTIKDQLQARVEELKIELKAAEEKALAYQPRASAIIGGSIDADGELSNEQRLAIQLADANRELGLATSDLVSVRSQVEEYKRIAQNAEDELASLGETAEQYREENDKAMAEKIDQILNLEKRVEDITTELQTTNQELSNLRTQHDDASRDLRLNNQALEAKVKQLVDDQSLHAEEKEALQNDVKAQAEIATQAQQNYDSELVKHADAARALQIARQELSSMRTEIARIRAEAEAAKATLETSQESWSEQKDGLEREISELKQRRIDIDAQNKRLHDQLETFSSQLQGLRQAPAPIGEDEDDSSTSASTANLQEIIRSLRRDKDIIEVQQELAISESRRTQQQLDYMTKKVDELQAKLAEERKQNADRAIAEASTSRLTDTINELNLYRESSITLRNEARQAKERYEEKSKELDRVRAELEPLQIRVAELEADLEVKDSEIKLITNDRDHWRERSNNVLAKYDRVDPAEIDEMKQRIATLEAEKQDLEAAQQPLKAQIADFETKVAEKDAAWQKSREAMVNQAKEKARLQNAKIAELKTEVTAAQTERARLGAALDAANAAATAADTAGDADTTARVEEAASLRSKLAEADAQATVRTVEVENLQSQIADHKKEIESLKNDLAQTQNAINVAASADSGDADGNAALLQALKDLSDAQAQIVRLQSERGLEDGETADVDAAIATVRSELERQHQDAVKKVEEAAEARIAKMKSNLQRQLNESKTLIQDEVRADLVTKHNAELQSLHTEHEQLLEALKKEHQSQLEILQKGGDASNPEAADFTATAQSLTDEQIGTLMKANQRLRTIMSNSVRKHVTEKTEALTQSLAAKDAEIAALKDNDSTKQAIPTKQEENGTDGEISVLRQDLEKAKVEKETAVQSTLEAAEKKFKVQLSMRDIAVAKVNAVQKAAQETPQRPVAEVWEEAKKARPPPKAPATAPSATSAAIPAPQSNSAEDVTSQDAKLQARKERFGNASDGGSTEGSAPNPEAAPFVPPASGIPTAAARGGRGGAQSGRGSFMIQGAATRGSGIARGARGGGAANAGIKRQHEGGGGGDGKRARGGGAAGGP